MTDFIETLKTILQEKALEKHPVGTRVRVLPSTPNFDFYTQTGFDPTGRLGTIVGWSIFYQIKLDDDIPHEMFPDNILCMMPSEFEDLK